MIKLSMCSKKCCRCQVEKEVSEFYIHGKNRKPMGACKKCIYERDVEKQTKLVELGLRKPLKKRAGIPKNIQQQILNLYSEGIGCFRIAKIVGFSKPTILRFLKKNIELRHENFRKHKLKNENFFDNIDADDKAYFLGLLWADGCNFRKAEKNKHAYQVSIGLQESDLHIIEELTDRIFENREIIDYVIKDKSDYNRQNQYRLRIPSRHISDTLLNYGMEPRKSMTAGMPINIEWSESLMRAYIRGFFDGDGSIFKTKVGQYGVSFISSVKHMTEMNESIEKYFGQKLFFEIKNCYSSPMACLKIHGNKLCKRFLDWLYEGSTVHLKRKYEKYLELCDLKKSQNSHQHSNLGA